MERPKCNATKIQDYRKYHLSGDLDNTLQGKVGEVVNWWEHKATMADLPDDASAEQIKEALVKQKEEEERRQTELETLTLQGEYEAGLQRKQQWEAAMSHLQEAKERRDREHEESMQIMKTMAEKASSTDSSTVKDWLQQQLDKYKAGEASEPDPDEAKRQEEQKQQELRDLQQQQEEIQTKN